MSRENRDGAQGLSNESRAQNMVRYQLGRASYHLQQAQKLSTDEQVKGDIQDVWDQLEALTKTIPQEGGAEAESLVTKGKKAQSKAKESENE